MSMTYRTNFTEITDQTQANPSQEGRATAVLHRIAKLYQDAISANDMPAVKGITEELSRREVELGSAIANGQGKTRSGAA